MQDELGSDFLLRTTPGEEQFNELIRRLRTNPDLGQCRKELRERRRLAKKNFESFSAYVARMFEWYSESWLCGLISITRRLTPVSDA